MPFMAPRPSYWTHPTPGVDVGLYGDNSMMGGHRGYDFGLDPNQKGGKRKKRVLSAAGAARQLARNELRLRLLRQLKKSKGAHQRGGMWEIALHERGKWLLVWVLPLLLRKWLHSC